MAKKLTREDIVAGLPEEFKGRTVHICGPNDDYDEEEEEDQMAEDGEELDPEYALMEVPEKVIMRRVNIEKQKERDEEDEAAGAASETLRLTKTLKEIKQFAPLHSGGKMHILKDETHALAINDLKISLFNTRSSQLIGTLQQENEDISTFAVSPNQQYLAVSTRNFLIRIYRLPELNLLAQEDAEDFKPSSFTKMDCLKMFKTPNQLTLEMTFDPSSKYLACGTSDSQIKVFDVVNGFQTHNFIGHRGIILKLAFFPDGDQHKLVSTAEDFVLKVWDLVLKKEIAAMKPKSKEDNMAHATTSILFTNDRKTIMSAGRDGYVHFWDATDSGYSLISAIRIENLGALQYEEINCMTYAASDALKDDPCLIIGGLSGQILVYSIKRKKIVFRADHSRFLDESRTEGKDPGFDPQNNQSNEIQQIMYLRNSQTIVAVNGDQNAFHYKIEVADSQRFSELTLFETHALYLDEIIDSKLVADSKQSIFCSNSETLKLLDLESGACEFYPGHSDIIITVDKFHCKEKQGKGGPEKVDEGRGFVLSGGKDQEIRLWRYDASLPLLRKLKCLAIFEGHNHNICSVNFAPKRAKQFVSASQENTIKVWDIEKYTAKGYDGPTETVKQATLTVMAHQKYINVAKFSPNDKIIATASQDRSVKLWSAKDLHLLATLAGHRKNVWDVQFSPYDKQIVTASGDMLVKVWNIQDVAEKPSSANKASCIATLQGHQDQLVKVHWLNMGLQVVTASADGIVKIWNVKKQQCVSTIQMHEDKVWALDVHEKVEKTENSDGEAIVKTTIHMITGGADSTVKLWKDSTAEQEVEDKTAELKRIQDEQKLSHLIREQDFMEAALLAFRLNKLRDFYHVLSKLMQKQQSAKQLDQVDSILEDMRRFTAVQRGGFGKPQECDDGKQILKTIVERLLQEDKAKLLKIIRNLNAKYEYSHLAQFLLAEVIPRFDHDEFLKDFEDKDKSAVQELKKVLEGTLIYEDRHYNRTDRFLMTSHFIDHIAAQMTLQEEKNDLQKSNPARNEDGEASVANTRLKKRQIKQREKQRRQK